MGKHSIAELNKIYRESDTCDAEIFSEQRSNIRLVNGEHHTKRNRHYWQRVRDNATIPQEQKVRITQNHIHKISKTYVNAILSISPDVAIVPNNESENQDQKSAELNRSVWHDIKKKNKMAQKKGQLASDFFDMGEVAVKCFFDKDVGDIIGYEPVMDEMGQPAIDEMGQVITTDVPIRSGILKIDRILAFNLLRDSAAKSKEEARHIIVRSMVDIEELKKQVGDDKEKLEFIKEDADDTYKVFNGLSGEYEDSKNQALVKEYYFKPCSELPNGYYYITTTHGILFEGELPYGIFPIVWAGFDDIQTSARSRSLIKQLRPYQAEINRGVAHMVEIQLSNGHDKVFIQAGAKISPAQYLPGVRAFNVSGMAPTIIEGRTGDQYLNYIGFMIDQLYKVAELEELSIEKASQLDPRTMLFANARQKRAFSLYADKFGQFLIGICETCLSLAKHYYTPQMLIPVIGKSEYINIPEFQNSNPLSYSIEVEEGSEDIESKLGRQLDLTTILQYAGAQLTKEEIGKIARNMPYANKEDLFSDLTIDYDSAKNVILALDRGEIPQPSKYDNHKYMIDKLLLRIRMSDFKILAPQIQKNYMDYLSIHEQYEVQQQKEIQAAQAGFIPAGGILVTVDFYVDDNGKQRRVRLPQDSIQWLIDKLNSQGAYYEQVKDLPQGALADMSGMNMSQPGSNGADGLASTPNMYGAGQAQGV